MGDYAIADRQWGSSQLPIDDIRDLWGEPPKPRGRKEPYIPHLNPQAEEYAKIYSLADRSIDKLLQWYEFRDDAAVRVYLANNSSLYKLLEEAHERIRKYFGPDARVVLDAIKDSEMDENERLFAFIQTSLSADDALDHLDELYEQWWLDRLSTVQPKMSIDVEFV